MSIRVRSLAPFLAAWAVLATLILSTPAGQANPGTMPAPAATTKNKDGTGDDYGSTDNGDGSVTVKGKKRSSQPGKSGKSSDSESSSGSESSGGAPYCLPDVSQIEAIEQLGYNAPPLCTSAFPIPNSGTEPKTIAQQAVATLTLPDVSPVIQPDPEWNQWKSYILGVGLWMWTDSPDRVETTVTQQGITIQITAVRDRVVFDMGNGDKVPCRFMTKYQPRPPRHKGPWESPTCGYVYTKLPKQECSGYVMTATTHWVVAWSVLGQSGTIPMTKSQSRFMPISELQSLAVSTKHRNRTPPQPACPTRHTPTPVPSPNQTIPNQPAPTSQPAPTRKPGSTPS